MVDTRRVTTGKRFVFDLSYFTGKSRLCYARTETDPEAALSAARRCAWPAR